jgi:hypothetical protein
VSESDYPTKYETWVDGQHFVVRSRREDPSTYDFDWVNHPSGYGFTTGVHPTSARLTRDEMERDIRDFLADIDPETGFLTEDD